MTGPGHAVEQTVETTVDAGDLLIGVAEECAEMAAVMERIQAILGRQLSDGSIRPDSASVQQLQEIDRVTQILTDLGAVSSTIGIHLQGNSIPASDIRGALRLQSLTDRLMKR